MINLAHVARSLEALPLAKGEAFQAVARGKLRYREPEGTPDLIDQLSASLICSALPSKHTVLVVFPDEVLRRPALLFSSALVMDALANVEGDRAGRGVLYLGNHIGIREQLGAVRIGSLNLDAVFEQQYGRGRGPELRPVKSRTAAAKGGTHLPQVVCFYAPADPAALIASLKPRWIAVDCGDATRLDWIQAVLEASKREGIPVVGWSTRPMGDAIDTWLSAGAGVLRWPVVRRGSGTISSIADLESRAIDSEISPRVLEGPDVHELSRALAGVAETLLGTSDLRRSRLASDAVMVGWRCLRELEGLSVPLDLYEQEASSYWGVRPIKDLMSAFSRFIEAVQPVSADLHRLLQRASDGMSSLYNKLQAADSPLWLGLANLCVDDGRRAIVFSSRAKREMFAFGMLSRFNMSEGDLRDVGVRLRYLTEERESGTHGAALGGFGPVQTFVGMPSRFAERQLDRLLGERHFEVLVWPHQLPLLKRRIRVLASELTAAVKNLSTVVPGLSDQGGAHTGDAWRGITVGSMKTASAGQMDDQLRARAAATPLWTRPEASEAIETLFGSTSIVEDEDSAVAFVAQQEEPSDTTQTPIDSLWIDKAIEIVVDGGRRLTLPVDETVNVIVHSPDGVQVHERFVRSVRSGDEILFIQGQNRQSLYELLVSRVHQNGVIAQYLALVRRWQDELLKSFAAARSVRHVTPETLLGDLQTRGSSLISHQTIRAWLRGRVLAPDDVQDLKRIADALSLQFVAAYADQIHRAARRLKGLHISLSARLNRWLTSTEAGSATSGDADELVDSELGLTVNDFRHSLLRLRVSSVKQVTGPFYRPQLGRLEN